MASFRVPVLRHVVSGAAPYLRVTQRRWAQVHDVRFLATQQSDRVLEKYKEKLARKAKEYGAIQLMMAGMIADRTPIQ
jgi:ATP synthase F1 complex assembly factor 1